MPAVTVDDLIADFRSDVFDTPDVDDAGVARDALWSDRDVLRYINSACAQLARDTLALRKRFSIAVNADEPLVRFPYDEILDVITAQYDMTLYGGTRFLDAFDIDEGIWRDDYGLRRHTMPNLESKGTPAYYTRDYDNLFLRLYPIPQVAGTLVVHAYVVPTELYAGVPLPFQSFTDRELLLLWMKKLAYAKQDADTLDLNRSLSFADEYKRAAVDRRSELDRIRRPSGGVVHPT